MIDPPWRMSSHRLRLGRHSIIGQVYVLTTTTHQRRRLFESEAAAACVIDQFDYIEQRGLVRSHAWVVMPITSTGCSSCAQPTFQTSHAG